MGKHVAAEDGLTVSELVDLALAGGPVTITRGGLPILEIRAVPDKPDDDADPVRIARERSAAILDDIAANGPHIDVDVVKLVREMRDEGW